MSLQTLGVILSILMGVLGLIMQVIAIGIYIGKLDGYKELVNFKISELTKKVEKHNNVVERTYDLEKHKEVQQEQIDVANHRISDLEERLG